VNHFLQNHWDKLLTFVLSVIVGGVVAFSAARVGLIDRIDVAKTSMSEKIDSVSNKVDQIRKDLHAGEIIIERIDVKVGSLENSSSEAKLDRREIISRLESVKDQITEIRVEIKK